LAPGKINVEATARRTPKAQICSGDVATVQQLPGELRNWRTRDLADSNFWPQTTALGKLDERVEEVLAIEI
jgi:hypothetical protein